MRKNTRKLSKIQKALSNQKGLTLIDVSVALLIIGLLIAPILYGLQEYRETRARDVTTTNIAAVDAAIREYFVENDFYPCPANPALPRNNAAHGISQVGPGGACTILNTAGLAEGSIPHEELGLDQKQVYDGWGYKLLYAVDNSRASNRAIATPSGPAIPLTINEIPLVPNPAYALGNPDCNLTDFQICANAIAGYVAGASPACNPGFINPPLPGDPTYPINNVHYTVLSHGQDGRGAFTAAGIPVPGAACNGAAFANEINCDGDAVYQSRQCINNDATGATFFDDYMVTGAAQKIANPMAMMSQSDLNPDGVAMGMEFVGIRESDPRRELTVTGNVKISDLNSTKGDGKDGAARADSYCEPVPVTGTTTIPNPTNCFDATLIGGSDIASPCPAGETMVRIKDNDAECERVLSANVPATNCPNGMSSLTIPTTGTGAVTCVP